MLNNIELGVKRGVNGVIASPHPMGGPFRVHFQFSNLDNIDSMITFSKSMFPYSMLNTFPDFMLIFFTANLPGNQPRILYLEKARKMKNFLNWNFSLKNLYQGTII